jgi:hypothetical protein
VSNVLAEYNRRQIYNHPHSIAERAADAARKLPPGPVTVVRARHADEIAELQRRHGAEHTAQRERHQRIRDDYSVRHAGAAMPHEAVKDMKRKVENLLSRHEDEASALRVRHRQELEKVVKANPLP